MKRVIKRDGTVVSFDSSKIFLAITGALRELEMDKLSTTEKLAGEIAEYIARLEKEEVAIEEIQDLCERELARRGFYEVAKAFAIYRYERSKTRLPNSDENVEKYVNITDDVFSKFKHDFNPFDNPMGEIVFLRTYSRFLKKKKRRETMAETARRAIEYNTTIVPTPKEEAIELFESVANLQLFPSGRTLFSGNTPVTRLFPLANFNCAFQVSDALESLTQALYLILLGCGYGFRIMPEDIEKLPKFRKIELINVNYVPLPRGERKEYTGIEYFGDSTAIVHVGDSKIGWVKAVEALLNFMTDPLLRTIKTVAFNYNSVRPHGERLKTFSGTASGPDALITILSKIHRVVINRCEKEGLQEVNLQPIDMLDMQTSQAEGVVVGGVRRSAEIGLGSEDDTDFINAKQELYKQDEDGKWIANQDLMHRAMSNNTIIFYKRPARERIHSLMQDIKKSGEPGFLNGEAALRRNPNFKGVNPCGEILLDSKQVCNLTTVVVYKYVKNGILNREALKRAFWLATRAGVRMSCVELELPDWDKKQKRDQLIGVSMTGWQDLVNEINLSKEEQASLLRELREVVHVAAKEYAEELGINEPLLKTTVKPEGTLSQLPTVSSGIHWNHSEYYIRRIRVNFNEPLVEVCKQLGYPMFPEVNQTWENCKTVVIEFPVKSPKGKTKYEVSAIEQLENYKMFMENYVDHNASCTISVKNDEWEQVADWVYDNWDCVVGLSFLSLDDSFYQLLPYESITEEEYKDRVLKMKPFDARILSRYEIEEFENDKVDDTCTGGCPVV